MEIPILKLVWVEPPNVPEGFACLYSIFDVKLGTQEMYKALWPEIKEHLRQEPTLSDYLVDCKPGDRLLYHADGSIKFIKK